MSVIAFSTIRKARQPLPAALRRFERRVIEQALAKTQGNVTRAARWLGIDRTRMYRRMKRLGINNPNGSRNSAPEPCRTRSPFLRVR